MVSSPLGLRRPEDIVGSLQLRIPLFLLGAVAILSGGLKTRARVRAYQGGLGLALLEVLAGVALVGSTAPGVATDGTMIVLAKVTGVIIVISSVAQALKAHKLSKAREESEGGRLYSQIKYSESPNPELPEGDPPLT